MSKRMLPLDNATPKRKRPKDVNQSRIDHFFGNSRKSQRGNSKPSPANAPQGELNRTTISDAPPSFSFSSQSHEVIDIDAIDAFNPSATTSMTTVPQVSTTNSNHLVIHSTQSTTFNFASLSIDPVVYQPQSQSWSTNTAPYAFLVHALTTLSGTRSRITIIDTLTNTLRTIATLHPPSLLPSIYLLTNSLAPPYSPIELGLGPSIISQSIQNVSGLTSSALRRLYNTSGDVGDVAFAAKSNLRTLIPHARLSIIYVYESLLKIAHSKGQGAGKEKCRIVQRLLVATNGEETRYITRTLSQNLRVGAMRTSILTALARAMVLIPQSQFKYASVAVNESLHISHDTLSKIEPLLPNSKKPMNRERQKLHALFIKAESLVKSVFVKYPDYDRIVSALLEVGLDGLADKVQLTVGVPLHPTLGSPTRSLKEVYDRLKGHLFSAEFKYDGQRAQIHANMDNNNHTIKIFSRHLEDMTSKYPDIVSLIQCIMETSPKKTSFILDSEIVAIDPVTGGLKSFQELSNRARKNVLLKDVRVTVCVFAFDLMYLNGQSLLQQTFRERRSLLRSYFSPIMPTEVTAARFDFVENCESESGEDVVQEFWERAVESRCEGLMIKLLDNGNTQSETGQSLSLPATYQPDKRTTAWLKLKKDYVAGIGDSLDLIPIGAWHGNGRKSSWWSPILMALWDPQYEQPIAVCKCMSGFTDAFYKELGERYSLGSETCSRKPIWNCATGGYKPDVYFKPEEVWEIRGADITESPVSVAAKDLVSCARGLSIRFPRFIKLRDDKSLEQASTPGFLAGMWRKQLATGTTEGGADEDELYDVDNISELEASEEDDE